MKILTTFEEKRIKIGSEVYSRAIGCKYTAEAALKLADTALRDFDYEFKQ